MTINPNPSTTFFEEKDQFFSNELDLTSHSDFAPVHLRRL